MKWNKCEEEEKKGTESPTSRHTHTLSLSVLTDAVVPVPLHIQILSTRCHPTSAINACGSVARSHFPVSFFFVFVFVSAFFKIYYGRRRLCPRHHHRQNRCQAKSLKCFVCEFASVTFSMRYTLSQVWVCHRVFALNEKKKNKGKKGDRRSEQVSEWGTIQTEWANESEWAIKIIKHLENYLYNVNRIESKSQQFFQALFTKLQCNSRRDRVDTLVWRRNACHGSDRQQNKNRIEKI